MKKRINLGIAAHVDAGKTTITEQLLYLSGAVRSAGSVDKGTAQTDYMDVERERGISVRAASTVLSYEDCEINLIDTPGHMDFFAEVERSFRILDCAVVVLSAVEGIQAQTEVIWKALAALQIPLLFFINKIDRVGADVSSVLCSIRKQFTDALVLLNEPCGENSIVSCGEETVLEQVCEADESLLEQYVQGCAIADIDDHIARLCRERKLFPVLCGSAQKGIGMKELLAAAVRFFPAATGDVNGPVSGVVFKVEHDRTMGRIAHVRLYSGSLSSRETVWNATEGKQEKITQIRKFYGQKYKDTGTLEAGDIGALCGCNQTRVGDILGSDLSVKPDTGLTAPLLQVRVLAQEEKQYPALLSAMNELAAEDPLLDVVWEQEKRELLIHITGIIQMEVIAELLKTRFQLTVNFGPPSVIYKETPAQDGIGFVAYTMPKPCWAVIKFSLEPLPRGSGVVFESQVEDRKILRRYQNQIRQAIPTALRQGPMGWEVTDLKITLIDGEHHNEHTHPLDFIVATPMAMMDGLYRTKTKLLEPMLQFQITAPEESGGRIMSQIVNMRGSFEPPETMEGRFYLKGRYPVAESMDFPARLAALTSGKGYLMTHFGGYEECPVELGKTTPYRGINPIDRAKYILYIRSALTE